MVEPCTGHPHLGTGHIIMSFHEAVRYACARPLHHRSEEASAALQVIESEEDKHTFYYFLGTNGEKVTFLIEM